MKIYAKHTKKKKIAIIVIISLAILVSVYEIIWIKAEDKIYQIAKSNAVNVIQDNLNIICSETTYDNIVSVKYTSDGKVSSINTDTSKLNFVKSDLCKKICKSLENKAIKVKIKIGDVFSSHWTVGKGIKISCSLSTYSAKIININNNIKSCGINQTLFEINADISINFNMLMPNNKTENISVKYNVPLSQTLIVGDVPSYYR